MLTIYKKTNKNKENPSGIITIENIDELKKPILLCISAHDNINKSIYGIIREGAQAARVYTTKEMAAGFKIEEMPIDFLGLRFEEDETYKKNYEEIVDKFLYPYLVSKGTNDINEIIRQARNINLMTYCDGTETYKLMEQKLVEKFSNIGFSIENIDKIISQLSLVAIETQVDTRNLKATTVTFIDVNDTEIDPPNLEYYRKILQSKNQKSQYGKVKSKNNYLYVYEGNGIHQLKNYFLDDNPVKPAISGVLSYFLENSIKNTKSDILIPVSSNELSEQLHVYGDASQNPKKLLDILDSKLSYDKTPKYTKKEADIMKQLDDYYKELAKELRIKKLRENEEKLNNNQIWQQVTNETITNLEEQVGRTK